MLTFPTTRDPDITDWAQGAIRAVVDAVRDCGAVVEEEAAAPMIAVALTVRGGDCLVCGCDIGEAPAVRCRTCGTPHHAECFRYVGRCAVYGCGSQEAVGREERGREGPRLGERQ